jgi:phage replication initiation protein
VDYLTVVIPQSAVEDRRISKLPDLLGTVFGFRGEVVATSIRDRRWQFYAQSANLIDRDNEMVGKVGIGGNSDSVCVSLSGTGTRWIRNWHTVAHELAALGAKITRCDLAFDDYEGKRFDVHAFRERAKRREFMQGGTPPKWQFIDDGDNGTGCTLYVGQKGHKQLCIYEKGKQMGLSSSPWVRAEVRLYGKHCVIPFETLTDPLAFLRGAYDVLEEVLAGVVHDECTRIKTTRASVEATGEAAVEWAHRQVGPFLNFIVEAFGGSLPEFVQDRFARPGTPGRFRGVAKGETLARLIYEELATCPASS